jgi:hypothetical protein
MGPIGDQTAWDRARRIAAAALHGNVYRPVGLAVNYHTTAIHPYWAPSLVARATIGAHIFYTRPDSPTIDAFSQLPADYEPQTFGRMRGERYENVRTDYARYDEAPVEQPIYAPRMRERYAPVQTRRVPGRDRYAPIQIAEIPIPERELSYGLRQIRAASRASATDMPRAAQPRTAATRSGPRVVRQNGVRIIYGN